MRRAAIAAALAAAIASGCGGTADPSRPAANAPPRVAELHGENLQSARCRHWRAGTPADRSSAVTTLQRVVGGRTQAGVATTLSDAEARRFFDRACRPAYARGYLLYELYTRASAFRSFLPSD